jgi:hypothetical protein
MAEDTCKTIQNEHHSASFEVSLLGHFENVIMLRLIKELAGVL